MSSLSPAPRPVLGALALAAALLLTACAGEEPQQTGTAGAPAESGPAPTSAATPETAPATGPEDTTAPAEDRTGGQGTAGPAEDPAAEDPAAEDPAAEPAADGPDEAAAERTDGGAPDAGAEGDGTAARGGTAGTGTGGSPLCTTSRLEVAAAPVGGAAGSVHVDVVLTNAGEDPCTLAGYAGVSFVDADGTMIGSPALRDATVPGTGQVLAPGESVTAGLRISQAGNHPTCDARTATGLRVYPPENTESVVIPFPVEACGDPRIHQLEIQGFGA
ncbi:DUF4232 domain-containing protein [Kocuria salina]|uniref:DUF4232 domain-containing protein n=1 Tax=Kocuria salina TaxID=1929416 RepID=UPI0015948075|nr:DUF4232 domain-containing protein [Kocuria salina]